MSLSEILSQVILLWECGHFVGPSDLISAEKVEGLPRPRDTVQSKHMGLGWATIQLRFQNWVCKKEKFYFLSPWNILFPSVLSEGID